MGAYIGIHFVSFIFFLDFMSLHQEKLSKNRFSLYKINNRAVCMDYLLAQALC
jgi:hypothetical protein